MTDQAFGAQLEQALANYLTVTRLGRLDGVQIGVGRPLDPAVSSLSVHWRSDSAPARNETSPLIQRAEVEFYLRSVGQEEFRGASVGRWTEELMEMLAIGPASPVMVVPALNLLSTNGHSHAFQKGDPVRFLNLGDLPAPLQPDRNYYVCEVLPNGFQIALEPHGSPVQLPETSRDACVMRYAGGRHEHLFSTIQAVHGLSLERAVLLETMSGVEGSSWVASITYRMESVSVDLILPPRRAFLEEARCAVA